MRVPKQLLQRVLGAAFAALVLWQACSMLTLWWYGSMIPRAPKPTPQACSGTCIMVNLDSLDVMNADMYGITLTASDFSHEHALLAELLYDTNFAGMTHSKLHGSSSSSKSKQSPDADSADAQQQQAEAMRDELGFVPVLEQLTQLPAGPEPAPHLPPNRPLTGWSFSSNMRLQLLHLLGDPHAVRLQVGASEGHIDNLGFSLEGFPLAANTNYTVRLRYRSMKADVRQLHFSLVGHHVSTGTDSVNSRASITLAKGEVEYASCSLSNVEARSWEVLGCQLTVPSVAERAQLRITLKGPGSADLDWVSLMPEAPKAGRGVTSSDPSKPGRHAAGTHSSSGSSNPGSSSSHAGSSSINAGSSSGSSSSAGAGSSTNAAVGPPAQWNGAVLDALRALRPRFVRIPVPGMAADTASGQEEQDRKRVGKFRLSNSVGLFEMMSLTKQLGSAALLQIDIPSHKEPGGVAAAAAKVTAAARSGAGQEKADSQAMLQQLTAAVEAQQKAEDEEVSHLLDHTMQILEFVSGPAESRWGKVRASMGHPQPWTVKYMSVVPDDCLMDNYVSWFNIFKKALSEKYPDIQLLASHCSSWEAAEQRNLWDIHVGGKLQPQQLLSQLPAALDHHPATSSWQKSPLVSLSNVASLTNSSNMIAAVAEAAVMAAAQRNCRKVRMVSHGPLVHVPSPAAADLAASPLLSAAWDGRLARTPSFHVHHMFAQHKGILCAGMQVLADGIDVKARMSSRHFFADEEYYDELGVGLQADLQGQPLAATEQQLDDDWLRQAEAFNLGTNGGDGGEGGEGKGGVAQQRKLQSFNLGADGVGGVEVGFGVGAGQGADTRQIQGERKLQSEHAAGLKSASGGGVEDVLGTGANDARGLRRVMSVDGHARGAEVQSALSQAGPADHVAVDSLSGQMGAKQACGRHLNGNDDNEAVLDSAADAPANSAGGTLSGASMSAMKLEASAICTDHQCNRVVVHVVNTGSVAQNVTIYLWSGLRKLFAGKQGLSSTAGDNQQAMTGRRLASALQPYTHSSALQIAGSTSYRQAAVNPHGQTATVPETQQRWHRLQQWRRSLLQADRSGPSALGRRGPGEVQQEHRMRDSVTGTLVQLSAQDTVADTNEPGKPERVTPRMQRIKVEEQTVLQLPAYSVTALMVDLTGNRKEHLH